MVRTREASTVFLVGTTNPEPLGKLTKLPTVRESLQRCIHLVGEHKNVQAALKLTTAELLAVWQRTAIPVREKGNVIAVLRKLHHEWTLCKKNKKRKDSQRKRNFERKLDTLLDISSAKYEAADERAKEFLADQRGCRRFSLALIDGTVLRRSAEAEGEADAVEEDSGCPDPDHLPEPEHMKVDHLD